MKHRKANGVLFIIVCLCSISHATLSAKIVYPCKQPDSGYISQGEMGFTADVKVSSGTTITKVEFFIDGKLMYVDPVYPFSYLWSARHATLGNHPLKVIAYSSAGDTAKDSIIADVHPTPKADLRPCDSTAYKAGLIPKLAPMFECAMRDPSICLGPDSTYYLVATTGADAWFENEGIPMWRSKDLQNWVYIGVVWNFDRDGTTEEKQWTLWPATSSHKGRFRVVWAPELCYVKNNYYLCWSKPTVGSKLLKSTTGKPEGPYVNVKSDGSFLVDSADAQLFEDTNGKTYFVYKNGSIRGMNDQITDTISTGGSYGKGFEGPFLFIHNNKYYLSVAASLGRYSSYVGIASSVLGPYSQWHEAIATGGHNTYFYDIQGNLWSTYFGSEAQATFQQRLGIMKITTNSDGTLKPSVTQPAFISGGPYPIAYDTLGKLLVSTKKMSLQNPLNALFSSSYLNKTVFVETNSNGLSTVIVSDLQGRKVMKSIFLKKTSFRLPSAFGSTMLFITVSGSSGETRTNKIAAIQ